MNVTFVILISLMIIFVGCLPSEQFIYRTEIAQIKDEVDGEKVQIFLFNGEKKQGIIKIGSDSLINNDNNYRILTQIPGSDIKEIHVKRTNANDFLNGILTGTFIASLHLLALTLPSDDWRPHLIAMPIYIVGAGFISLIQGSTNIYVFISSRPDEYVNIVTEY